MKVGLHVPVFAWQGGSEALADHLADVADGAEAGCLDIGAAWHEHGVRASSVAMSL